jgi:magnesium-transporting ATPase (P-type)
MSQHPDLSVAQQGGGIAIAIGDGVGAKVILAVILINTLLGFVQDGNAERTMDALANIRPSSARALPAVAGRLAGRRVVLLAAGTAFACQLGVTDCGPLQQWFGTATLGRAS